MTTLEIILAISAFLIWTGTVWLLGYFMGFVAGQNKNAACPFANLPPAKEKEPRGVQITPFAGKEKLIIALVILTAAFTSCFPKQPPLIVEKPVPCAMPELRQRKPLPGVYWLLPEKCPDAYKCLNEAQYAALKDLVATLRAYEKYLVESYNAAKERCSE